MDSLPLYVSVHSESIENSSMKALDYSDDDTSLSSLDEGHQEGRQICTKNAPPPRVLVIDELETKQIKSKDCTLKISKEDGKLGSPNRSVTLSSPQNENDVRSKISTPVPWACRQGKKSNLIASSPSSNPSVFSTFIDYFCARSDQEDVNGTTTTKDSNRTQQIQKNQNDKFEYTITKTFLEAWISKKGSGNDIFGSISWKPRWCQLVLAKVPLYEVEVPLLLVSWHFSMPSPSTIIILDNKLAIRIDGVDSSDSNVTDEYANRFDVVSGDETTSPLASMMTRSFSAQTVEERNKWVDAINDAIGNFERSKKSFRRAHSALCLPPTIPRTASTKNVNFDDASELEGLDLVY